MRHHLGRSPYPDVAGSEFILEPRIDPLTRGQLCDGSLYRDASGNVIGVVVAIRPISTDVGKSLAAPPDSRVVRHLSLFIRFASLFSVVLSNAG